MNFYKKRKHQRFGDNQDESKLARLHSIRGVNDWDNANNPRRKISHDGHGQKKIIIIIPRFVCKTATLFFEMF